MAVRRGKRSNELREAEDAEIREDDDDRNENDEESEDQVRRRLEMGGVVPELARRIVSAGLQSFFTTEEVLRKAVGDSLPQDWINFANDQSTRTQTEFMDRLVREIGRVLDDTDLAELIQQLLQERSVEIHASIRLAPLAEGGGPKVELGARSSGPPTDAPRPRKGAGKKK